MGRKAKTNTKSVKTKKSGTNCKNGVPEDSEFAADRSTAVPLSNDNDGGGSSTTTGNLLWVDPARVRYQHSRIRPVFSGCGRSVVATLESIRRGELRPSDLPPIQVLVGPVDEEDGEPWYFSLNNRRLWVLKECRREGLRTSNNNRIQVRVRTPKSDAERARYTLQNCALEAKIVREKSNNAATSRKQPRADVEAKKLTTSKDTDNKNDFGVDQEDEDDNSTTSDSEDEDDADRGFPSSNRFSALL